MSDSIEGQVHSCAGKRFGSEMFHFMFSLYHHLRQMRYSSRPDVAEVRARAIARESSRDLEIARDLSFVRRLSHDERSERKQ